MATLICDLEEKYPKLFEKATMYQMAQRGRINVEQNVDHGISWADTDEKGDFWMHIYYGKFERAKVMYPHLFEPINKDLVIQNNGLWTG